SALIREAQATDWGFHDAIVAHLGNGLVSEIHRVNLIRIRVIMQSRIALSPEVLPPAFAEHAAILAAVEERDAEAAVAALRRHLETSRRRALGLETGREADRHAAAGESRASAPLDPGGPDSPAALDVTGRKAPARRTA
ncbi:FCD domain-containing protein, partial [Methylobacterium indicum]|uniref:FCD domain-containing protein n=1 Tax=Methylobacterium indicum TaxID=1775910 RepID=UPI000A57CF61